MLILMKNNYIVRIISMFFTSTRKGSNQCNSRYIIYRSGRNQQKFQGPPIVGPPFPYYSHTTTIRILWSMGWYCNFMERGTSVGSWRDPSEVVVHVFFCKPSRDFPRYRKPALHHPQIRIRGFVYIYIRCYGLTQLFLKLPSNPGNTQKIMLSNHWPFSDP